MKRIRQSLAWVFAISMVFAAVVNAQQVDPKTYGGMKWRLIGPFRGGRAITVAGVPSQPNTYYFGAVGGGVWRTSDGGNTWDPLFEKQGVSSTETDGTHRPLIATTYDNLDEVTGDSASAFAGLRRSASAPMMSWAIASSRCAPDSPRIQQRRARSQ